MKKLLVFDIDGTLAPYGAPLCLKTSEYLRLFEKNGMQIVIASGKPISYIEGFCRGAGLANAFFIGENGAVLSYKDNEARICMTLGNRPYSFARIREQISALLPAVYFQDNQVNLTAFFNNIGEQSALLEFVRTNRYDCMDEAICYISKDCVEWTPAYITKANGVGIIQEKCKFSVSDTICVGDGENDIPLAAVSNTMLVVGTSIPNISNAIYFLSTQEVLEYLINSF